MRKEESVAFQPPQVPHLKELLPELAKSTETGSGGVVPQGLRECGGGDDCLQRSYSSSFARGESSRDVFHNHVNILYATEPPAFK